jgi:TRAP-type C4-dicarboxylate transport system permease small subunit
MDRWERLDKIIGRMEQFLVAILLSLMIIVVFSQIVLRNFFYTGLSWGDPLVRYLVLWVGFIGASIATKEGRHITIDVLSRWISGRWNIFIQVITSLFSAFICGLLTFAALKFIRNEVQIGVITFLGIPSWMPPLIIPVTLGLMALRFALLPFKAVSGAVAPGSTRDNQPEK